MLPIDVKVADSHAHLHMLPDPAWELVRCAANGVDALCMITDPSEDGSRPFDELDAWLADARAEMSSGVADARGELGAGIAVARAVAERELGAAGGDAHAVAERELGAAGGDLRRDLRHDPRSGPGRDLRRDLPADALPAVTIAVGVHPHNARLYDDALEAVLVERLADSRVVALGEIGLDYHYDLSPRDVQRRVFRRQIERALERDLPIALHLRGGEDPATDNAHAEAFEILRAANALGPRTLLHCCALSPDELAPWVEADCYIAYGGAVTFKNADAAREGARLVPENRLLVETDAPYMTPEPMRGAACTPAHVIFTAAALRDLLGVDLRRLRENWDRWSKGWSKADGASCNKGTGLVAE